ncbi:MAG: HAMP domain-containing histidine kinase [Planctomycetes bacterium]|nr:HAMP domain-containing histidine kinase [Planctomycetota bacterium]
MKSIRLSLIVYFLLLATAALAAVSWFAYSTSEQSLLDRQRASEFRIRGECDANCEVVKADLDRRLLLQARALVRISKSAIIHAEPQFGLLNMIGAWTMPTGPVSAASYALYGHQVTHAPAAIPVYRAQPVWTYIEDADDLVGEEDTSHAREYFQLYNTHGFTLQRSMTMGDRDFTLDQEFIDHAEEVPEKYEDVVLERGVKVRRLTMRTHVASHDIVSLAWPFVKGTEKPAITPPNLWGAGGPPKVQPKGAAKGGTPPKGGGKNNPPTFRGPPVIQIKDRTLYIQYASDLAPTEARFASLVKRRDEQLAQVHTSIERELAQLRSSMMWIGLSALAALWLGGYLVIRIGLAPLSRMSDAVSKVSAKDFQLPLDATRLPNELRPIASRLSELLEHLHKAFEREKQAAADISHELRTPLAALMTTLEVGLNRTRSVDEYREILDDCHSSGLHMYQLVERLLTLARLDAGADQYRPAPTDVTELALQCADLIRPLAKARGIELRLHLPDPVGTQTDSNKLREVLVNLLHNAVEYNKPDGVIDLSVERINGQVRLEVRDTGIGIKPDALAHIFERFYRADPSRHADTPHAGLGLAIVKSYVDLMGGTIQVDSSPDGTAFVVVLPFVKSIHDLDTAMQAAPALAQR